MSSITFNDVVGRAQQLARLDSNLEENRKYWAKCFKDVDSENCYKISDIRTKNHEELVDLVVVVKSPGILEKTVNHIAERRVELFDDTNMVLVLLLHRKRAENFDFESGDVIRVSDAKVEAPEDNDGTRRLIITPETRIAKCLITLTRKGRLTPADELSRWFDESQHLYVEKWTYIEGTDECESIYL